MKKTNQSAKPRVQSKLKVKRELKGGKLLKEKVPGGRGRQGGPFQI
jgi:hypothetical protein